MNFCCEDCGWSEIVGSPIMCNYTGRKTYRDKFCGAWKPKEEEETNMVEVVRCKDCKHYRFHPYEKIPYCVKHHGWGWKDDDYCSYAERRDEDA